MFKKLLAFCSILLCFTSPVMAKGNLTKLSMCVFDPVGKSGPAAQVMRDFKLDAVGWGAEINDSFFDNEWDAINAFKSGQCDVVNMLGFRASEFNSFTGSIRAVGSLQTYEQMGMVIKTMSSEAAAKLMRNGDVEVIGIMPAGKIFVYTRDRALIQPDDLKGKTFAMVEKIPENDHLSKKHGYLTVTTDIFGAFQKFNKGEAELVAGPALVYEPFELSKGVKPNGGIYKDPVGLITMQMLARWEKLPKDFAQNSRNRAIEKYQQYVKLVEDPEKTIPSELWIDVPKDVYDYWENSFRESRIELSNQGIFDKRTLKLLKKVRCVTNPEKADCQDKIEGS